MRTPPAIGPGDLVVLRDTHSPFSTFTVGSLNRHGGWNIPNGSVALVVSVVQDSDTWSDPNVWVEVIVDGKRGWVYPYECLRVQ